jgi:hypothetical protein
MIRFQKRHVWLIFFYKTVYLERVENRECLTLGAILYNTHELLVFEQNFDWVKEFTGILLENFFIGP